MSDNQIEVTEHTTRFHPVLRRLGPLPWVWEAFMEQIDSTGEEVPSQT